MRLNLALVVIWGSFSALALCPFPIPVINVLTSSQSVAYRYADSSNLVVDPLILFQGCSYKFLFSSNGSILSHPFQVFSTDQEPTLVKGVTEEPCSATECVVTWDVPDTDFESSLVWQSSDGLVSGTIRVVSQRPTVKSNRQTLFQATQGASPSTQPSSNTLDLTVCSAPTTLSAAKNQARQLIQQIQSSLTAVENQIRNVPFLSQVEAHNISLEKIAAIAAEQYNIIRSDWNSFSLLTSRFDDPQSRIFFGGIASGEGLALQYVLDFATACGLTERNLAAYEPRPKAQTYPSRVAWIASNSDRAVAGAAFFVNFGVFGENMGRLRDALIHVYGFSNSEVEFFSFFAEPIPGFEENAIEVIAAGLRRGACEREIKRQARLLQAYELDFWQALSDPVGSSLPVHRP